MTDSSMKKKQTKLKNWPLNGIRVSQVAQWWKICLPIQETQEKWVQSLGQEDPWRRKWQPTPVFLSGKSHGQRSLVGYSPWGHKELDTAKATERTHIKYALLSWLINPAK